MRSSSVSSSRSPSPNYKSKRSKCDFVKNIFNFITILISLALIILIPYVVITTIKGNSNPYAVHITFICSLAFHFLMVVQDLITPEKLSLLTIWYCIHTHYFLNNLFIYYSELKIFPFFISVGSRSLFALFKILDDIYSNKTGNLAKSVLSFSRQVVNSIQLHRFGAILEILEMPCLIVSIFMNIDKSKSLKILVVLGINIFFLLMCYHTDPYHKWVWKSIRNALTNCGHRYRDSFGIILFAIVSFFDFFSNISQFLFPPVKYNYKR